MTTQAIRAARACNADAARAGSRDDGGRNDEVAAGNYRVVPVGHRVRAVGLGNGTLPTPPHAVRRLYQSRVQSL